MSASPNTTITRLFAILAMAVVAVVRPTDTEADAGEAVRLAPVVARILSYERTLPTRAGATVDIGVLYAANDPSSQAEARAYVAALGAMTGNTIQGLPMRAVAVPYTHASLQASLAGGADVLLVCSGLESHVAAIAQSARARGVLTVGLVRSHVQSATSIAVVMEAGRPKIVAHLGHARAEGMQFSSQLLRLSEVL